MQTREQKLQKIREKCIEANESIKDLVFGCDVKVNLHDGGGTEATFLGYDETKTIGYFTWAKFGKNKTYIKTELLSRIEIIGREVRLADVLNAMSMHVPNNMSGRTLFVGNYGGFYEEMDKYNKRCNASWNLSKDNLEDQTDETINFIYQLIESK